MLDKAKEIALYMMETGTQSTTEGVWRFPMAELDERFGTDLTRNVPLIEAVEDVLYRVYGEAILDLCIVAPPGIQITEDKKTRGWCCAGECPGYQDPADAQFDLNFALAYCPNYARHDGDEAIFGNMTEQEFENRKILSLPEMSRPMTVYVITGEWMGIQEDCLAFTDKSKAILKFEELTKMSWSQYLDGEYTYDSAEENNDHFYRFQECVADAEACPQPKVLGYCRFATQEQFVEQEPPMQRRDADGKISIYWDDLVPGTQQAILDAFGCNLNYDVFPIAEISTEASE